MNDCIITTSTQKFALEKLLSIARSFGGSTDELENISEYLKTEIAEIGDNRLLYFLSSKNEGTIGTAQLILKNADNDPELANNYNMAHVHGLQIDKRFHRKGLGRKLMQYLEDDSKRRGITKLTLGVDGDNIKAISLYKSLQYKKFKECEGRDPGSKLYYMCKELA